MTVPFLRWFTTKFRSTPQLAHMTAKDIHELQQHIREAHREWEEVKTELRKITELSKQLPEGAHHDALAQVFKFVDAFKMVEERYDDRLKLLQKKVKALERGMEHNVEQMHRAKHEKKAA